MIKKRQELLNKYFIYILIISLFIFLFIMNLLTPKYGDDWVYSFIFRTDSRISNLWDIFYSQYLHYFLWGGRSVAHFIAQTLLLINKYVADLLNSLVYILLIYLIYIISCNSFKIKNFILVSFISSLLILFLPVYSETILLKTVSSNYLWTTVIILLFITPFVLNIYKKGLQKNNPYIMFFLGIIAGWTNENSGFALIVAIIIFMIIFKKRNKNVPYWVIFSLVGVIIGFSLMVLAPGNELRVNKGYLLTPNFSYFNFLLIRLKNVAQEYMLFIFPLTFIYVLFFIIYKLTNPSKNNEIAIISIVFLVISYISIFIMIGSPVFPPRACFCAVVFHIIAISILLSNILSQHNNVNFLFYIITIFLLIGSSYKCFIIYEDTTLLNKLVKKMDISTESNINNKIFDIVIPYENIKFETSTYNDLSNDSTNWFNRAYAKYKNIHTIRLEEK